MIETLSVTVAVLGILVVVLVFYIFNLIKKPKTLDKNDPEFIKLQSNYETMVSRIGDKENYIEDLKKDKQLLIDNSKNADDFKEISEKSFKEYNSLVTEYRNFHEKLVGNFKYQGSYNEKKLQKLLEKHGLVKDQDFTIRESQTNINPETGEQKTVLPDFVINLPEDNSIVIDCKVSLTNFASFANEKDKKLRNNHLKKHIDRVKDHIKSLSKKNYNKIHNLKSFQYVIMFMPFDTCYLSVLEHDDGIIEYTHQYKVILAGPISIMALIANVTSMKNQEKQQSIVENIVSSAEKVYDKYKVVKDNIRTLVSSFKTHKNSVEGLINNTYGSKKGLENLIKKLKDDHGLNPGNTIVESTEADKVVGDIDDPEEKKVVNYKE